MAQYPIIYLLIFDCTLNVYSIESFDLFSKKPAEAIVSLSIVDQGEFNVMKSRAERLNTKCQLEY